MEMYYLPPSKSGIAGGDVFVRNGRSNGGNFAAFPRMSLLGVSKTPLSTDGGSRNVVGMRESRGGAAAVVATDGRRFS